MKQTKRCSTLVILVVLILAFLAGSSWASPRAHDTGFFLRLSGGFGYARSKVEEGSASLQFSGMSGDANLAIGGCVTPNLALHATILGWLTSDPEVKECLGGSCETASAEDVDFSLSGFGAGVTYYFMPANMYISGSICAAKVTLSYGSGSWDSDRGPAIDVAVGKEWWVGDNWGLGVAGSLGYHSVGIPDFSENWSGPSFGIRFSATYN